MTFMHEDACCFKCDVCNETCNYLGIACNGPHWCGSKIDHWFVYIIECAKDNSLYTGITNDVDERIIEHNNNKGAKYTRGRGPVKLIKSFGPFTKSTASRIEYTIKQLSRVEKLKFTYSKPHDPYQSVIWKPKHSNDIKIIWFTENLDGHRAIISNKIYGIFYDTKSSKGSRKHIAEYIPYASPPRVTLCGNQYANFSSTDPQKDDLCKDCETIIRYIGRTSK